MIRPQHYTRATRLTNSKASLAANRTAVQLCFARLETSHMDQDQTRSSAPGEPVAIVVSPSQLAYKSLYELEWAHQVYQLLQAYCCHCQVSQLPQAHYRHQQEPLPTAAFCTISPRRYRRGVDQQHQRNAKSFVIIVFRMSSLRMVGQFQGVSVKELLQSRSGCL
jgi:hypothetical protein